MDNDSKDRIESFRVPFPREFVVRGAWMCWSVYSRNPVYSDATGLREAGPFWRRISAERVAMLLTQHFRDGWCMGRRDRSETGGGRFA